MVISNEVVDGFDKRDLSLLFAFVILNIDGGVWIHLDLGQLVSQSSLGAIGRLVQLHEHELFLPLNLLVLELRKLLDFFGLCLSTIVLVIIRILSYHRFD